MWSRFSSCCGGEPVLFSQPGGEDILRSPQILGCRLPEEMKQTHTNTQRHTNTHTHIRAHTHPSVGKLVLWVLWAEEQGRFILSVIACTPQGWQHTEVISSPSDDLKIPVSVHFENTPTLNNRGLFCRTHSLTAGPLLLQLQFFTPS